ncbi:hypothetical protein G9A89_007429 [Geosiphon pyriformis]|nr:hypothetical protein G9A89_007429 [Geosiphon pyriformis]
MIKPVDTSVGNSGSGLAGLGTCPNTKKKQVESIYSRSASFKNPKKPEMGGALVDLSVGSLNIVDVDMFGINNISSIANSVCSLLDVKNMVNTIAEETSYIKLGNDKEIDETMLKKTCTCTYMLGNPSKAPSFEITDIKLFALDIELKAVPDKTIGDKLITVKKFFYQVDGFGKAFTPSKFPGIIRSTFTFEISLKKAKEIAISKKILVDNNVRQINKYSN